MVVSLAWAQAPAAPATTDAGLWRTLMGIDKQDTLEAITQKLMQWVEKVRPYCST